MTEQIRRNCSPAEAEMLLYSEGQYTAPLGQLPAEGVTCSIQTDERGGTSIRATDDSIGISIDDDDLYARMNDGEQFYALRHATGFTILVYNCDTISTYRKTTRDGSTTTLKIHEHIEVPIICIDHSQLPPRIIPIRL